MSMGKPGKLVAMEGRCPVCGTAAVLRTLAEPLTMHRCPGCSFYLAITPTSVIVVPEKFARDLLERNEAEQCGRVVSVDLSTRYRRLPGLDDEYMDALRMLLSSDDLDPRHVLDFLDMVDDHPLDDLENPE
jgi:hypothetical protein